MARPTKYTDVLAASIAKSVTDGNTFRVAAILNGISLDTLNEWRKRYPAFSALITRAEAEAEAEYVATIKREAKFGDVQAAKFWLTHRNGDDWRPPKETKEITGADGGPVVVVRKEYGPAPD